jgi:hypothetical protein
MTNPEPIHLTDRGRGPGIFSPDAPRRPRDTFSQRVAWKLRCWADRLDHAGATKHMTTHSFTFEDYEGIRFRDDGWGCPLAYIGNADYDRAHTESDTAEHQRRRDAETRETLARHGVDLDDVLRRAMDKRNPGDARSAEENDNDVWPRRRWSGLGDVWGPDR